MTTTAILPQILAQMARVASLCQACGKVGTVYDDDNETVLCGRCWLLAHGKALNDG